ncbi:MAG: hypothetical protein ACRCY7_03165 [Cetobacterium sp.]|uniref:hypothetical protein n=1 Tax=Cetobacterium sp. TaxID=2071632 RepID=UPI003F3BE3B8
MLIAKTEKELIEIIEQMEKHGIESCHCGQESLSIKPFHINYTHRLEVTELKVEFSRLINKKHFFKLIHERKNEECIKIPGAKGLFSFKYFLEKYYKIKFEEVPDVENNCDQK